MSKTQYILANEDGESFITVIIPGEPKPLGVNSTHSKFDTIVKHSIDDNLEVDPGWFSPEKQIISKFSRLSDRVTVANGVIYFDGDPMEDALTKQILAFLEEDIEDWKPLVKYFEKVQSNPNEHSRKQLYVWLSKYDVTIASDGRFVAYKGVNQRNGDFVSVHAGPAIVDDVPVNGHVKNNPGSTIEIARSDVHHNPSVGCASGLHVGTWAYASSFAPVVLEVHVDPRDVVSVPTDCDAQKVRTCRYEVIKVIEQKYESSYLNTEKIDDDFAPSTPDEDASSSWNFNEAPKYGSQGPTISFDW